MNEPRMKEKLYLETSVLSFLTGRPSRNLLSAAWQSVTVEWWETCRNKFDLYVSELVHAEVQRGDSDASAKRATHLKGIPLLEITPEVVSLAKQLVKPGLLPAKAADDALHSAVRNKVRQIQFGRKPAELETMREEIGDTCGVVEG